jgi:hypothetical protein
VELKFITRIIMEKNYARKEAEAIGNNLNSNLRAIGL